MKFDWNNPYPTIRAPLFARNAVATSQPLAAQAGATMLRLGGNAVDAALAAAAVLTIVEPVSNGIGSDAFAIVWDGVRLQGLNGSGGAPLGWTPEYFTTKYGANAAAIRPKRGWDTVTVPGAVAAWAELHEKFGKLNFSEVVEPAAELAERGFGVGPVTARKWSAAIAEMQGQPGFDNAFMPRGRAPHVGERFQLPAAARSLRQIGATRGRAFYEGELADRIVRFGEQHGAALTHTDLSNYRPEWVTPISQRFREHDVHELPPNGQGIATLIALGILEYLDLEELSADSVESIHLQIEAMKLAFADVYRYVADPRSMQVSAEEMLDPRYLSARASLIKRNWATHFNFGLPKTGGTVYLTAADADGMMVSFIQSNYMGFGSGIVVPETGISLQNRGLGLSLDPESPNFIAPGKKPFHTIIPGFLTKEGRPVMSFGVMGGDMQPQGHVQTLARMLCYRQQPQAACDAPRWKVNRDFSLDVESTVNASTAASLAALGHRMRSIDDPYMDFGSGQFIWRQSEALEDGYIVASDSRREGQAAGF